MPGSSRALDFDGSNDRVFIPDDPLFELTESFTLEAYIKLNMVRGNSQIVFRGDDRGGLDPWFLWVRSTGQLTFSVVDALAHDSSVVSPEPLPRGEFVHVAGVLDDATGAKTLYINGVEVASKVDSVRSMGALLGPKPGVAIGSLQSTATQPFNGYIDEVRISNTALDPSEFLPPLPETTLLSIADGEWDAAGTWNHGSLTPSSESGVVVEDRVSIAGDDAHAAYVSIRGANAQLTVATDARLTADQSVFLTGGTMDLAGTLATQYLESFGGTLRMEPTGALGLRDRLALWDDTTYRCALDGESMGQVEAGAVVIGDDTRIEFEFDGAHPFKAGTYTLMYAASITGEFDSTGGLGRYVSVGEELDGLTYTDTTLTLTIDRDLHPADANLSGRTDLTDFNMWNANKFTSDTGWTSGDFNGDGNTDLSDFNIWNAHKFTVANGGAAPAPTEVPEPGTVALLIAGMAIGLAYRRRMLPRSG